MHVRFSARAEADLDNLHRYIAERNPRAADRIVDSILLSAFTLENFPMLGRPGQVEGTREFTVPRTGYLLVYTLPDAFTITIQRILHARQKWPPSD